MSILKVNSIVDSDGLNNTSINGSTPNYYNVVGKNKIINGSFDIWQRNVTQTSSGYGSDDRWVNGHVGTTKTTSRQSFTVGQVDVPGNPKYFSRTIVTSVAGASNYCSKSHRIEGVNVFSGETCTLSFWAKADAVKNIAIELEQSFGTGGVPSGSITGIGSQQLQLLTNWKKFTVTVNIPSISGKVLGTNNDDWLGLNFWFDAGTSFNLRTLTLGQQSGTFDIAQVQLEAGDKATTFEQRPVGLELQLCQRYYEKTYDYTVFPGTVSNLGARMCIQQNSSTLLGSTQFNINKRSTPVVTIYSPGGTQGSVWSGANDTNTGVGCAATNIGTSGFRYINVVTTPVGTGPVYTFHFTADAEI